MFRYNEKKHCFEFVREDEYMRDMREHFEMLKKTYGDVTAAFDPIKEILRNMDKSEAIKATLIDFDIDDEFEFKQSDFDESKNKSKKEALVESAMDRIDEILPGEHFRAIRGSIEQQIRRAYKQGYCDGIDDAPGEYDSYREGFIDGVAYCKQKTWQIRPEEGLEKQKMDADIFIDPKSDEGGR